MAEKQNQQSDKTWVLFFLRLFSIKVIVIIFICFILISLIGVLIAGTTQQESSGVGSGCSVTGELNPDVFNQTLENAGVFKGKGDTFITIAKKQNIDPALFAAIAMSETGWGKSDAVVNKNNPGGCATRSHISV